jgi:hypothetical protein
MTVNQGKQAILTHCHLISLLDYCAEDGIFYWRISRFSRTCEKLPALKMGSIPARSLETNQDLRACPGALANKSGGRRLQPTASITASVTSTPQKKLMLLGVNPRKSCTASLLTQVSGHEEHRENPKAAENAVVSE